MSDLAQWVKNTQKPADLWQLKDRIITALTAPTSEEVRENISWHSAAARQMDESEWFTESKKHLETIDLIERLARENAAQKREALDIIKEQRQRIEELEAQNERLRDFEQRRIYASPERWRELAIAEQQRDEALELLTQQGYEGSAARIRAMGEK